MPNFCIKIIPSKIDDFQNVVNISNTLWIIFDTNFYDFNTMFKYIFYF